ncbi:unnamed protein product [Candidula unifasciata]|uniref:BHLH domain-containing protein n=1 Tax=Candidula unifasciata TaxID=100452 RepID=A0A8S3YBM5_9EUPU|nr:unnamed protein product [Candidula unifasciata]
MVPLIMSVSREDNPSSAFEEFGTHLSLYDDSFHFVEKPVPAASSSPLPAVEDSKGTLPPSVFYPICKNAEDAAGQVKVKRKCGRPRNPIPRHKRESHINAEHRRRGKIQDGFRTLKGMVPKYEQSSGRDSKADILFKAVDYCKLLQNDIKELGSTIEALREEKDAVSVDIKNYKTVVPDLSLYDDSSVSLDEHYSDYVQCKSKEHWAFATFKVIMRPLFESYKLCVRGNSLAEFLQSVADWAANSLSLSNLRTGKFRCWILLSGDE